jgi:hypothetical protein
MIPDTRRAGLGAVLGCALAFTACEPATGPAASVPVVVRVDLSTAASPALVVVEVTAPDITSPLVFNIAVVNNVASDTVTLPVGPNRTVTLRAFDTNGIETHRGSVTVNIAVGSNPTVTVILTPLTGEQPISATIGRITITVTPPAPTVSRGATVTLTAAITDVNGEPVTGAVRWATRNPGVATVSATGVVTGVGAGQTTIVATYQGAAGSATVTVP